jgi:ABC-type transport system substrate-binding protein
MIADRTARMLALALAAMLVLPTAACLPGVVGSGDDDTAESITVVMGQGGFTLNPYSPLLANRQVGEALFRGLTDVSADGMPVPDLLAELPTKANGGLSADGRSVRLALRDDATWHDGEPVDAEDVRFTLEALREGAVQDQPLLDYGNISSVTVVGPSELVLELAEPDAPLAWTMVPYVLPAHLLEDEAPLASSSYWFEPVGSGPYRVASFAPAREVTLRPVDEGAGEPIRAIFTASSEAAREAYDAASAGVWLEGPSEAGTPAEHLVTTAGTTWRAWIFDVSNGSIFSDGDARRAFMSLISHEDTDAVPAIDPFGLPLQLRSLRFPEAVAGSLRSQGWRPNADGILERGGMTFEPTTATRTLASEELPRFEATTAAMDRAGIAFKTFTLDFLDVGGYFERDYLITGEWDLARTRFYATSPLIPGWPFESGDGPNWSNPYGANLFGVEDAELDDAYSAVRSAGDPAELQTAWQLLGRRLGELDVVYWEYPEPNHVLVKGVEGVVGHAWREKALQSAVDWRIAAGR